MSTPLTQVSDYTTVPDWSKDQAVQGNRLMADRRWATGHVNDSVTQLPVSVVPVEIRSSANNAGTLLTLDQDEVDQLVLSIEATNTTADVVNISAAAVTTANVIDVPDADGLTTGTIQTLASNSLSTSARSLLLVANSNTLADEAIPIVGSNASTGPSIQALSTAAGAVGAVLELSTKSASGADNDVVGRIRFRGDSEEQTAGLLLGQIDVIMTDAQASQFDSQMSFYVSLATAQVEVLRLRDDGSIAVNLSAGSGTAAVFDDHDDALVTEMMSSNPQGLRAWMLDNKMLDVHPNTGHEMTKLSPFLRLLTGVGYQNRHRMDEQHADSSARIASLETTLARLAGDSGDVIDVEGTE